MEKEEKKKELVSKKTTLKEIIEKYENYEYNISDEDFQFTEDKITSDISQIKYLIENLGNKDNISKLIEQLSQLFLEVHSIRQDFVELDIVDEKKDIIIDLCDQIINLIKEIVQDEESEDLKKKANKILELYNILVKKETDFNYYSEDEEYDSEYEDIEDEETEDFYEYDTFLRITKSPVKVQGMPQEKESQNLLWKLIDDTRSASYLRVKIPYDTKISYIKQIIGGNVELTIQQVKNKFPSIRENIERLKIKDENKKISEIKPEDIDLQDNWLPEILGPTYSKGYLIANIKNLVSSAIVGLDEYYDSIYKSVYRLLSSSHNITLSKDSLGSITRFIISKGKEEVEYFLENSKYSSEYIPDLYTYRIAFPCTFSDILVIIRTSEFGYIKKIESKTMIPKISSASKKASRQIAIRKKA